MTRTETVIQAILSASEDRKEAALRVLQGCEAERSSARGRLPEPFVGLKDVAEFLGVSARSVWRWRVPGHKLGSRTRFRLSEVASYLESDEFRRRTADLQACRREG